jgi:peroxiredoxin
VGYRFSFLIGLCLACGCGAAQNARATRLPPAPVVTLAGEATEVARVAGGRVALVSLWATWCDGCDREIDSLNRLEANTGARRDAVVIGIAVGEPRAKVEAFVRKRGLRYVQLVDEDFRFADTLGERRIPTTLIVDRAGRIVYRGDALDAGGLAALRQAVGSGP